jgi:hypothetical protein
MKYFKSDLYYYVQKKGILVKGRRDIFGREKIHVTLSMPVISNTPHIVKKVLAKDVPEHFRKAFEEKFRDPFLELDYQKFLQSF